MDKTKKAKMASVNPHIETQNLEEMAKKNNNLYKSIYIIARRSNQISKELKEELHSKLEDFASVTDTLEEINENREQIEISRIYEKLPHATLLATNEFLHNQIYSRVDEDTPAAPTD